MAMCDQTREDSVHLGGFLWVVVISCWFVEKVSFLLLFSFFFFFSHKFHFGSARVVELLIS